MGWGWQEHRGKQGYLLVPEYIIRNNECSKRGGWAGSPKLI